MKHRVFVAALLAGCMVACQSNPLPGESGFTPIEVSSPQPDQQLTKVNLTPEEAGYVESGNQMAFKLFPLLFKEQEGGKSFLFSPLSIQYALGMTANGTSGETRDQIVGTLGFGADIGKLNTFCNKLLKELPAQDLAVTLKLADAIVANGQYPLQPSFKELVEGTYYAAVENLDFGQPEQVAAHVNNWASKNTNGLIDNLLDASLIDANALAFLMNALYFHAPWVPEGYPPLFDPEFTRPQPFRTSSGEVVKVPAMSASQALYYADMGTFRVLEIPYANRKFAMYVLLPDSFEKMLQDFPQLDWNGILAQMELEDVTLQLPKFETSSNFRLNDALQALGMQLAFTPEANFKPMFQDSTLEAYISFVIQKARISVAEWGTEAAAVTVVGVYKNAGPSPLEVRFICDRPFAYLIAEKSSGAILFAGAYLGN